MKKKIRDLLCCALLAGCLGLYVVAYVVYQQTVISFLSSILAPAMITLCSALVLYDKYEWLFGTTNKAVGLFCHIYIIGAVSYATFMGGNFWLPANTDTYTEAVTIVGKKITQYEKTYRVGRRMHRSGQMVYSYYLDIVTADNMHKEIRINRQTYYMAKEKRPAELLLQKGVFGLPVIKSVKFVHD